MEHKRRDGLTGHRDPLRLPHRRPPSVGEDEGGTKRVYLRHPSVMSSDEVEGFDCMFANIREGSCGFVHQEEPDKIDDEEYGQQQWRFASQNRANLASPEKLNLQNQG